MIIRNDSQRPGSSTTTSFTPPALTTESQKTRLGINAKTSNSLPPAGSNRSAPPTSTSEVLRFAPTSGGAQASRARLETARAAISNPPTSNPSTSTTSESSQGQYSLATLLRLLGAEVVIAMATAIETAFETSEQLLNQRAAGEQAASQQLAQAGDDSGGGTQFCLALGSSAATFCCAFAGGSGDTSSADDDDVTITDDPDVPSDTDVEKSVANAVDSTVAEGATTNTAQLPENPIGPDDGNELDGADRFAAQAKVDASAPETEDPDDVKITDDEDGDKDSEVADASGSGTEKADDKVTTANEGKDAGGSGSGTNDDDDEVTIKDDDGAAHEVAHASSDAKPTATAGADKATPTSVSTGTPTSVNKPSFWARATSTVGLEAGAKSLDSAAHYMGTRSEGASTIDRSQSDKDKALADQASAQSKNADQIRDELGKQLEAIITAMKEIDDAHSVKVFG
jgi:hypothetical protein